MIKSLLFTSFLAFSSGSAFLDKAPFYEPNKQNDNFSTFETESYFNNAFGNLSGYDLGIGCFVTDTFEIDYMENYLPYYAFPIYYDISFVSGSATLYYSNDYFNFYLTSNGIDEGVLDIKIVNYTGSEESFYFGRLNSSAMASYIPSLTGGVIGTITEWVTGFIGVIVAGLSSFVAVFYTGEKLTAIGTLALLGLGIGLVTLAIAFVTKLFKR